MIRLDDAERLDKINKLIQTFPNKPGVYVIYNIKNEVIYVGKAKDLVKRLRTHFQASTDFSKSRVIREQGTNIKVHVVGTENEAYLLEYNMIKEYDPVLNEKWKDGKTYPYLMITTTEKFPRLEITRDRDNPDNIYLGPFSDVTSLRKSIRYGLQLFPVADCNKEIHLGDSLKWAKTCIRRRTKQCLRPCEIEVDEEEYGYNIKQLIKFFDGKIPEIAIDITHRMKEASKKQNFEDAAKSRDLLRSINRTLEKQKVMLRGVKDGYYLSHVSDSIETCLCIVKVFEGRILRQDTRLIENDEINQDPNVWIDFTISFLINILELHDRTKKVDPNRLIIDTKKNKTLIKSLSEFSMKVTEPVTEVDKQLIAMTKNHAKGYLQRQALLRKDRTTPHSRVLDLQKLLNMEEPPLVIDSFDVSTLLGTNNVASCVRFVNGQPEKSAYRRFKIRTVHHQDDFASMEEAVYRRYRDVKKGVDPKGLSIPDLIVIDGGSEQLKRANDSLKRLKLTIPVVGLAKREEEIYQLGTKETINESVNRPAILLLRAGRDEAHRFAVKYQRTLRHKEGILSILDGIKGIGPVRKEALIKKYKTVSNIAKQSSETISEEIGISKKLASELIEISRIYITTSTSKRR